MKKIVLSFAVMIIAATTYAQLDAHWGIKGGVNISNLKVKDADDNLDSRVGFHIGGLAHIHVANHFAFQPELLFSSQGAKDGDDKLNLSYLSIPLLAQYMTGTGFRIQTGPQLGFLLSAKAKNGESVDIKDQFNGFDASWIFGASYVTNSGFGVDARYNLGLTNVNEEDEPKVTNRVWQLGVFYQFQVSSSDRRK